MYIVSPPRLFSPIFPLKIQCFGATKHSSVGSGQVTTSLPSSGPHHKLFPMCSTQDTSPILQTFIGNIPFRVMDQINIATNSLNMPLIPILQQRFLSQLPLICHVALSLTLYNMRRNKEEFLGIFKINRDPSDRNDDTDKSL